MTSSGLCWCHILLSSQCMVTKLRSTLVIAPGEKKTFVNMLSPIVTLPLQAITSEFFRYIPTGTITQFEY